VGFVVGGVVVVRGKDAGPRGGQGQSARHSSDFLIRVCYLRMSEGRPSMSRLAVNELDCLKRTSYREVLYLD
jgi:hypothetical protein